MVRDYLKQLETSNDFEEILLEELKVEPPSDFHEAVMKSILKQNDYKRRVPFKRFAGLAAAIVVGAIGLSLFTSRLGITSNKSENRVQLTAESPEVVSDTIEEAKKTNSLSQNAGVAQKASLESADSIIADKGKIVLETDNKAVIEFINQNAFNREGNVYKINQSAFQKLLKYIYGDAYIKDWYSVHGSDITELKSFKQDELLTIELIEK